MSLSPGLWKFSGWTIAKGFIKYNIYFISNLTILVFTIFTSVVLHFVQFIATALYLVGGTYISTNIIDTK